MKQSNDQYRNIKGVYYACIEYNSMWFKILKQESRDKGLKYRIINEQFYQEVPEKEEYTMEILKDDIPSELS